MSNNSETDYPKYQIFVDGQERWLPLGEAGRQLNSYMIPVRLGDRALEASGVARAITKEEHNRMIDIADEWDANK